MIINNDGRIMSDLINSVVNKTDIILKSKGEATRAFCYISDAITALMRITLDKNMNQVYNLANETEEISIKDLAYNLKDWFKNKKIDVVFKIEENKNQYVKFNRTKLNTKKINDLGWNPQITLEDGIKRTVKFFELEKNSNILA